MTEQGYPPRQAGHPGRSGRSRVTQEPRRSDWQRLDAFDDGTQSESDAPPWAVPGGIEPIRPVRRPQRDQRPEPADEPPEAVRPEPQAPARRGRLAGRSRAAAARRRRSKRRLVTWGGTVAAIALILGGGWYLFGRSPAPKPKYITTLQKGEVKSVPNACKAIGATVLGQYVGDSPATVQPFNASSQSECTYTEDKKPAFRELNILVQAYPPNLTVPVGNGSATATARYTFAHQQQQLAKPLKGTPQPPATISAIHGLGDQAISAEQVFKVDAVTDRVTVIVRYRNVLVTVYLDGQTSDGFGPVSTSELRAGALAVARDLLGEVKREPTTS